MCLASNVQSEPIINFYSADTWALVISIFALTISIWQWARVLWKERFALNVKCTGYQLLKSKDEKMYRSYTFGFIVDNLSSIPVSISYISFLSSQNEWVRFCLTKRFMKDHFIPPGLENPYHFFTSEFPVNIAAHSSVLIYAISTNMVGTDVLFKDGKATFTFNTSRKEKTLTLNCSKISVLNQ